MKTITFVSTLFLVGCALLGFTEAAPAADPKPAADPFLLALLGAKVLAAKAAFLGGFAAGAYPYGATVDVNVQKTYPVYTPYVSVQKTYPVYRPVQVSVQKTYPVYRPVQVSVQKTYPSVQVKHTYPAAVEVNVQKSYPAAEVTVQKSYPAAATADVSVQNNNVDVRTAEVTVEREVNDDGGHEIKVEKEFSDGEELTIERSFPAPKRHGVNVDVDVNLG